MPSGLGLKWASLDARMWRGGQQSESPVSRSAISQPAHAPPPPTHMAKTAHGGYARARASSGSSESSSEGALVAPPPPPPQLPPPPPRSVCCWARRRLFSSCHRHPGTHAGAADVTAGAQTPLSLKWMQPTTATPSAAADLWVMAQWFALEVARPPTQEAARPLALELARSPSQEAARPLALEVALPSQKAASSLALKVARP